jgi:hypothetical protein
MRDLVASGTVRVKLWSKACAYLVVKHEPLAWFLSLDLTTRYLVRREFFETHWRTR